MATSAQIAANIANAQHSTGPRSGEGKQRAAANSTVHGLTSASAVLSHEDQSEYDRLLAGLIDEFLVESSHERFLVEQMAQARWRIYRIDRIENRVLEQMSNAGDPELDPDGRIAAHLLNNGAALLSSLQRYRTASQNAYVKFSKLLCDSRANRVARRTAANIDESIARIINAPIPMAPNHYTSPRVASTQNSHLRL